MAGEHNFTIDQGATWNRQITWEGQNITGFTARMYLKRSRDDVASALQLTTENSRIVLTTPASGLLTLTLTAAQTEALTGSYVYDLELVNGATVTRLLQGIIAINENVTK